MVDLDSFLSEWRRELSSGGRVSEQLLGKNTRDSQGLDEENEAVPAEKRAAWHIPSGGPLPLLVLPAGGRTQSNKVSDVPREGEGGGGGPRSLVDRLIADLDEINTVPFFDVQLPRELALIIFGYLGMQDLGRKLPCNRMEEMCHSTACLHTVQVSRSWHSLAEDNVLWCGICHSLGLNTDLNAQGGVCWKMRVRDAVLERRQVERNWKERVCGISDHQPDNTGVLCAVDSCQQYLLACYSSGAVYTWDVCDERGPVRLHQTPTLSVSFPLFPPVLPTTCALTTGWAAVGTEEGCLTLFDMDTSSQVFSLPGLGSLSSISLARRGHITALTAAHCQNVTHSEIMLMVLGRGEGERRRIPVAAGCKVSKVSLVPFSCDPCCPYVLLYSTPTTITLQHLSTPLPAPINILTSTVAQGATCISCYDFTPELVACGTTAFGYQVQLFDLPSCSFRSTLRGHGLEVTCVNVASSPPSMVVTGSADKRVRVFDYGSPHPVQVLRGHTGQVCSVQMDEWKVVSGRTSASSTDYSSLPVPSLDGTVIVWDQRMARELWRTHERHPVELCRFSSSHLMVAHLPLDKRPLVETGSPLICHRRQRGLVRVFDFSVDPLYYTRMLPSICSSTYDEPTCSFYNLDLKFPYDAIT